MHLRSHSSSLAELEFAVKQAGPLACRYVFCMPRTPAHMPTVYCLGCQGTAVSGTQAWL